jgi:predicted transglutaminase-like cysteine proteinase
MCAYARRPALSGAFALAGALVVALASPAGADGFAMRVNGLTNPPLGYLDFCRNTPQECAVRGGGTAEALDEVRWRELNDLNSFVNHIVVPETDMAQYHAEEVWALPGEYGDCEDYVLLKRKLLGERGWPTGSLLITVVFDEVNDGHAVLLVRTDRGDMVLDNKVDTIRRWQDTPYRYVKRQSVEDPNRWVSLGDPRWTTRSTAAPR